MKVSIIMPTYNSGHTILESIESAISQTHKDFELIIVDDGSTDNTKEIINNIKDNRIKYIYQKNKDQLNAVINGSSYASGDYYHILHSDDLFPNKTFLENMINEITTKNVDVLIGNLELIDENSKKIGEEKLYKYIKHRKILAKQLLWLGRNLFNDFFFSSKDAFYSVIMDSYLTWNMPFWINFNNNTLLNVKNSEYTTRLYRIHEENYINNDLGKMNVINGEIRTAVLLMKKYTIPFYNFQYFIFRAVNKFGLGDLFYPLYLNKPTKNKTTIINKIIKTRYQNNFYDNIFISSIYSFYHSNNYRSITIPNLDLVEYFGKDIRIFNKLLIQNQLPEIYKYLFSEMKKGFSKVIVKTEEEEEKMKNILKFLCIDSEVIVESEV
ncbi:MAG: glycosyltransferase family 2 protein [Bacilli bacterium]